MRTPAWLLAAVTTTSLLATALPAAAMANMAMPLDTLPQAPVRDTGPSASGLLDGAGLDHAEPDIERKSDDMSFVAHLGIGGVSDAQFQRREGLQTIAGEEVDTTIDLAFVGAIQPNGLRVVDVTDPTSPTLLAEVACGAFHNDVAVFEHRVVLGFDGSGSCEQKPLIKSPASGPGVAIFDVTDPANPVLERYLTGFQGLPRGPHNISVHPEAGLLYLSFQALGGTPYWGYVDLTKPDGEVYVEPLQDRVPYAGDGCHDQGLGLGHEDERGTVRDLLFCAGITATYIWDITDDPRDPQMVSTIANPTINLHHGARMSPDGTTLAINDENISYQVCGGGAPVGAQWFYDIALPEAPVLISYGSTDELDPEKNPCTSHFYNFIPGTTKMVTGWYRSGMLVHDWFLIGPALEESVFLPQGATFWSAYAWHGYLYGFAYDNPATDGMWVVAYDGMEDLPPAAADEGTSWARWTGTVERGSTAGDVAPAADRAALARADGWAWALLG